MGRPSVYSDVVADMICNRIASGETLSEICRDNHMPPKTTVWHWVNDNRNGFAERYARARDMQLEHWADEMLSVSDDGANDWMERNGEVSLNGEHVQRSRLRVDTRKWLMSKLRPDKYGDRLVHAGDERQPVQTVTRIELVGVAPNAKREIKTIDAEPARAIEDKTKP